MAAANPAAGTGPGGGERPATGGTVPGAEVRASDAERDQVAALLQRQAAAGRLTMEEFEERVHSAYQARTRGQLGELTGDLPGNEAFEDEGARGARAPAQIASASASAAAARRQPPSPLNHCLLCFLLCICPPAGLLYWLMWHRNDGASPGYARDHRTAGDQDTAGPGARYP